MNTILAATKTCHHYPIIEKELKNMNIIYKVQFIEDHPDLVQKYHIQKSPVLIVDEKVAFYGMPDISELRKFFKP